MESKENDRIYQSKFPISKEWEIFEKLRFKARKKFWKLDPPRDIRFHGRIRENIKTSRKIPRETILIRG